MKLRLLSAALSLPFALAALPVLGQQPAGVADAIQNLASKPVTPTDLSFDPEQLQAANARLRKSTAVLNSVTVENFHYPARSFFVPEHMASLKAAYDAAGYHHMVQTQVDARAAGMPQRTLMDLWLHNDGTNIDSVFVMLRAPRQMSVIELSGTLKPQDIVRLSGHFSIPRIDPSVVMVPAPVAPRAGHACSQVFNTDPPGKYGGNDATDYRLPCPASYQP